jgi:hypothetical protein
VVCGTEPEQTVFINSFNVNLEAVDGTVTYSNFINRQSAIWTVHHGAEINTDNVHYWNGWGGITSLPPGVVHLATITITGISGSPKIAIVDKIPAALDFTAFGSRSCSGNGFDNTLKLDGPNTRAVQGIADWFDWSGLGVSSTPPEPPPLQASVFVAGGNRTVRLGSGKPQTCVQIEPVSGSFDVNVVDLGSIRMALGSVEIPAIAGKTMIDGDGNQNGVVEITACFSKENLRVLFAGMPTGDYTVALRGDVGANDTFEGTITLHVINDGSFVRISPNPLNPKATLSFVTSKPGSVRIEMYDVQGRLIRALMNEANTGAGSHHVTIDGHDANGGSLASGIYHIRVRSSSDGEVVKAITILK